MFVQEIARAVQTAPRARLPELSLALWKAHAAGAIGDDDAQALAEEIAARKAVPAAPAHPRRTGSRPRAPESLERRRSWAAGGWMPPTIAAAFTQAEVAALAVIIREIATTGRCALPISAIAARAGICAASARNAVREARARRILHVEERRVAYDRNLPNVLTIVSRELALWVRTRARVERQGGGCKTVSGTTNHLFSNPGRPSPTKRSMGQSVRRPPSKAETVSRDTWKDRRSVK